MLCKYPFRPKSQVVPVPCGKCGHCKANHQRIWSHRMVLESYLHSECAFVTLTYRPEEEIKLPGASLSLEGRSTASLVPRHYQLFLKSLRQAIAPKKIRFYVTGEYGDVNQRPHFHFAVFGLPSCIFGRSRYEAPYNRKDCCPNCDLVRDSWGRGGVHLDQLNIVTAGYICGYVQKGMTALTDPRLAGRHPEFSKMSNRPGLGYGAMVLIAKSLVSQARPYLEAAQDAPASFQSQGKLQPLGRYLKEKLRGEILKTGMVLAAPGHTPEALRYKAEMQAVWRDAQALSPIKVLIEDLVKHKFEGKRLAIEAKRKLFAKGKYL